MEPAYLAFVSEQGFKGTSSPEYKRWLESKKKTYSNLDVDESFDEWVLRFIPKVCCIPKEDIALLSLPKVFKVPNQSIYDRFPSALQLVSMQMTGNREHLIIAIL